VYGYTDKNTARAGGQEGRRDSQEKCSKPFYRRYAALGDADSHDRQADGPLGVALGVADRTVGPHDGADWFHRDRA
jgi:hypothetical protein